MEIKPSNIRQMKNGKGYVTSYTVSIGSKEARDCGFTADGVELEKVIDPDNQSITFRVKRGN